MGSRQLRACSHAGLESGVDKRTAEVAVHLRPPALLLRPPPSLPPVHPLSWARGRLQVGGGQNAVDEVAFCWLLAAG